MILLLLKLILLTAIWVLGIKIATAEDMVLEKLGNYGKQKVEEGYKIFEALWVCEWCMPSVHSIIGYAFAVGLDIINGFDWKLVILYPLVVMGTSVVTGFTWNYLEKSNAITEYYKNANN